MNDSNIRITAGAVLLALVLFLAACSDASDETAEVDSRSAPSVADSAASSADDPDEELAFADTTPDGQVYFSTRDPGEQLPSGVECGRKVRAQLEQVVENKPYNESIGRSVAGKTYLSKNIEAADLESRIDGDFVGTTDEIIQWGACKWGFDENNVRAQAYAESSWFAGKLGDCGESTRPETGGEGGCSSVGLLQIRSATLNDPVFPGLWPMAWKSTAFNVDYTLAVRRACFEGREVWLNNQPDRGSDYAAGDEWGCIGRWFSGNWHDPAAENYIRIVEGHLDVEPWGEYAGCPNWQDSFYCSDLDREIADS